MRRPVSEKRIRSLKELRRVIEALDLDEGVRIVGRIKDLRGGGFIFVTTVHTAFAQNYCVNIAERIYDRKAQTHLPGGKEKFRYFSDAEEVFGFVEIHAARPLRAWYY